MTAAEFFKSLGVSPKASMKVELKSDSPNKSPIVKYITLEELCSDYHKAMLSDVSTDKKKP